MVVILRNPDFRNDVRIFCFLKGDVFTGSAAGFILSREKNPLKQNQKILHCVEDDKEKEVSFLGVRQLTGDVRNSFNKARRRFLSRKLLRNDMQFRR